VSLAGEDRISVNQNQSAASGIGGWLILVAIGLCLTPLRISAEIVQGVRSLQPGAWHAVTTPGSPAYHPLFGPLIVGELVANVALLLWALVLLYLFFTKRRAFPRAMIAFLIVRVAIQMADIFVARSIPVAAASIGPRVYSALAGNLLVVFVWVPYFLKSRRVAATFIG
jgi:uncharacterized protein DUF2569